MTKKKAVCFICRYNSKITGCINCSKLPKGFIHIELLSLAKCSFISSNDMLGKSTFLWPQSVFWLCFGETYPVFAISRFLTHFQTYPSTSCIIFRNTIMTIHSSLRSFHFQFFTDFSV